MAKVGLVVPVLRNFRGLAELLFSCRQEVYPVILDNWRHTTRCVGASWNEGIEIAVGAGCTHVLVSNDDVILGRRTIPELVNALDTIEKCVLATGRNTRVGERGPPPVDIDACAVDNYGEAPDFSCFMVRKDFFDLIGRFDSCFRPGYFEDNSAHYRIKLAGLHAYNVGKAPMYHAGSVTQNFPGQPPACSSSQFNANRELYKRIWGGVPGEEKFTSPYNDPAKTFRDHVS